jgi:hypothetical protein
VLSRFALQYRIAPNAMTRARLLAEATADDCAAALLSNLDRLTSDASFIQGINLVDSDIVNPHLHALAQDCRSFSFAQEVGTPSQDQVIAALQRYVDAGLGSGTFAGSALGPLLPGYGALPPLGDQYPAETGSLVLVAD